MNCSHLNEKTGQSKLLNQFIMQAITTKKEKKEEREKIRGKKEKKNLEKMYPKKTKKEIGKEKEFCKDPTE